VPLSRSKDLIRTNCETEDIFCKLGDTSLVTRAVGAFSFFDFLVFSADSVVARFDFFWLVRRRFLQIQRMGFLGGSRSLPFRSVVGFWLSVVVGMSFLNSGLHCEKWQIVDIYLAISE
jgi:hypothetical protein